MKSKSKILKQAQQEKTLHESTLGRQVEMFFQFLRLEKNVSANTIASYRFDLQKYTSYLSSKGINNGSEIKENDISNFLEEMTKNELAVRSISRTLSAIRGFHRFLLGEHLIKNDPTQNISRPKREFVLPEVLDIVEVEKLLQQPDVSTPLGIRDRAVLEVLYATGIRVSELTNLKLMDLLFTEELIQVF
jgi:integrase/recombinase XerD